MATLSFRSRIALISARALGCQLTFQLVGVLRATTCFLFRHSIEKLEVDGPNLRNPHQSAVMGEEGFGLRELRPRRGRCRWRPLYRRVGARLFVILAVVPESEVDSAGYKRGVRTAQRRLQREQSI
jgi:hypothetical protein